MSKDTSDSKETNNSSLNENVNTYCRKKSILFQNADTDQDRQPTVSSSDTYQRRKSICIDDNGQQRRKSIHHGGRAGYLRPTETSYRRMSIVQGIDPGRKLSLFNLNDRFCALPENGLNLDEDEAYYDTTREDLNEIESEISRVQHFIGIRNKYLKLDELKHSVITKSVEFDEASIRQQETERQKSVVDSYMYRRHSVTKSTFI